MNREETAAKAHYESGPHAEKWEMSQPAMRQWALARIAAALAAADAHDAARGIHRVSLDDATVERVAKRLWIDDPDATVGLWGNLIMEHEYYRTIARAVLAAAVEAGQ